jgi:hypothetical protein
VNRDNCMLFNIISLILNGTESHKCNLVSFMISTFFVILFRYRNNKENEFPRANIKNDVITINQISLEIQDNIIFLKHTLPPPTANAQANANANEQQANANVNEANAQQANAILNEANAQQANANANEANANNNTNGNQVNNIQPIPPKIVDFTSFFEWNRNDNNTEITKTIVENENIDYLYKQIVGIYRIAAGGFTANQAKKLYFLDIAK